MRSTTCTASAYGVPCTFPRPDSSPCSWVAYSNLNRRSYLLHDAIGIDSVGTSRRQGNRVCTVRALALLRTRFRDSALSPTGHVSEPDCAQ
jgi:hypothetical protein